MSKNIKELIDEIFHQLINNKLGNIGLMEGETGKLFFIKEYLQGNPSLSKEIINNKLNHIFENISILKTATYCDGFAGIGIALTQLYNEKLINLHDTDFFSEFDDILEKQVNELIKKKDYDFLHGLIGLGFYFLERKRFDVVEKIISELDQNSVKDVNGVRWFFKHINFEENIIEENFNLSIAHGISAVIVFLSRYINEVDNPNNAVQIVKMLLKESIRFLNTCRLQNKLSIFPNAVYDYENEKNKIPSRLAWCYGDLTIGIAFWLAGKTLEDDWIKKQATDICLHTCKRTTTSETFIDDAGFCHGTAGIAFIYHKMYCYTSNENFKISADYWINETVKFSKFEDGLAGYKSKNFINNKYVWVNDYSLLNGITGIGLVLLNQYNQKQHYNWDRLFLLS